MIATAETCWPSPLQETLLRAVLLDGDVALQAWRRWRAEIDLDHIDPDSNAILAPLSANLQRLGVEDSLTSLLKGVRRQTWAANHHLIKAAAAPLRRLDAAGIPLLLLNGAALAVAYYQDFGLRAFAAVDVLVPVERVSDAIALLERSGWTPVFHDQRRVITENYLRLQSAVGFRNSDGTDLILHWHVMPGTSGDTDEVFWRASQTAELEGQRLRILAPTDELLHVMANGIKVGVESKLCWAVDALTLLRMPDIRVDWARLVAMAQRLRLVLLVRDALVYLRDRLDASIPTEVIAELTALPTTRMDRMDYRLRTTAHTHGVVNVLTRMWLWHRRLSDSSDAIRLLSSFPRFLQRYYEIDSPWRLPAHAASRAIRRLQRVGLV